MTSCRHLTTIKKHGKEGLYCVVCGEKVYDVNDECCVDCEYCSVIIGGVICKKFLMTITLGMRAIYDVKSGNCFEKKHD